MEKENTRVRLLLKTIAQESTTLRLLSFDPERLKKQFGLSDADLDALRSADLLRASELSGRRNPANLKAFMPGSETAGAGVIGSTGVSPLPLPPPPPPPGVLIVNMTPRSLSGEQSQDSEPTIAVNPSNTQQIAGTAFTPNPSGAGNAPIYVSSDGGQTWVLNAIVGSQVNTADITISFSESTNHLYAGTIVLPIQNNTPRVNICRTNNLQGPNTMTVLFNQQGQGLDQPRVLATTVGGKDRVYVGVNDFNAVPSTATIEVSLDAASSTASFNSARIDPRPTGNAGQDGPSVQPAIASDGKAIYAIYYHWTAAGAGNVITADIVVVRDDNGASAPHPFSALVDSDGLAGKRVVQGISFQFDAFIGQERTGGDVAIAVDPTNSSNVYIVYADRQPGAYTLHVRRSTDRGVTWSAADLLTIPNATNPFLAINAVGKVGLVYQQVTGAGASQRWVTHLRRTTDGATWNDLDLANVPANTPAKQFDPFLGDYVHLLAVGNAFYGIFCANNTPDPANFPNGVRYQRNANFSTHTLLAIDGTTPVPASIDPFFFTVTN